MHTKKEIQQIIDTNLQRQHELRQQGKYGSTEYKQAVMTMNEYKYKLKVLREQDGYDEDCGCIKKVRKDQY